MYKSTFEVSPEKCQFLKQGKITAEEETPSLMIERVIDTLSGVEKKYGHKDTPELQEQIGQYLDNKDIVFSSTIMTNAGRYLDRPLAACVVPKISTCSIDELKQKIRILHKQGMGTGYNLSSYEDPISVLKLLNNVAVKGQLSGEENRPVGNIAILNVYHPKILEFIKAKENFDDASKFNISIDLDSNYFAALEESKSIVLADGTVITAESIMDTIVDAAYNCGDPGVVFLDTLNHHNPVPGLGNYKATAPCGEVGLSDGESCQFGYINLGHFVNENNILWDKLRRACATLTRYLDNAIDISIDNSSFVETKKAVSAKRKIGLGICGLADLFFKLEINYDSEEARVLAKNIVSFMNYNSKIASVELAKIRGCANAMKSKKGNGYFEPHGYIENQYASKESIIPKRDWLDLGGYIKSTGLLRNVVTIALPPTGRSSYLIGASPGIEPFFKPPKEYKKEYFDQNSAIRIKPLGHLMMTAALQEFTDESISKTINLCADVPKSSISDIIKEARLLKLCGITVYVDGSKANQPLTLN